MCEDLMQAWGDQRSQPQTRSVMMASLPTRSRKITLLWMPLLAEEEVVRAQIWGMVERGCLSPGSIVASLLSARLLVQLVYPSQPQSASTEWDISVLFYTYC